MWQSAAAGMFNLFSNAPPLYQSKIYHEESLQTDIQLHKQALETDHRLHEESLRIAHQLHKKGLTHANLMRLKQKRLQIKLHQEQLQQELQHHIQKIVHDTETARRENVRDVFVQHTRNADAMLISITLLIGCYFNVIVQGAPPLSIAPWLLIIYALVLGLSWAGLFLSLWFTMKNQQRMTYFNMYSVDQIYYCGKKHRTFEDYFDCHCKWLDWISSVLFYSGTFFLVVSAGVLVGSVFYWNYDNWISTVIYGAMCTVIVVVLFLILSFLPVATRKKLGPDSEKFMADFNARIRGQISTQDPALKPVFHSHSSKDQLQTHVHQPTIAPFTRNFLYNSTNSGYAGSSSAKDDFRRSQLLRASAAYQQDVEEMAEKAGRNNNNANINNNNSLTHQTFNTGHQHQSALKSSDTVKTNNTQQQVNFASPPRFRRVNSKLNWEKQEDSEQSEQSSTPIPRYLNTFNNKKLGRESPEPEDELSEVLHHSQDTQQQVGDLGSDRDLLDSNLGSDDDFLNSEELTSYGTENENENVDRNQQQQTQQTQTQQTQNNEQQDEQEGNEEEEDVFVDDMDTDDEDDDSDDESDDGMSEEELERQLEILRKETRREMKSMTTGPGDSTTLRYDDDDQ